MWLLENSMLSSSLVPLSVASFGPEAGVENAPQMLLLTRAKWKGYLVKFKRRTSETETDLFLYGV